MGSYMHARNAVTWALLAALVIFTAVMGACLGRRGAQPSEPDRVLVQFPTAIPAPTPTPLPTRDPIRAKPQDEAGSRALRFLSEVAGGRDPYFYQGALGSSIRIVVCPYGCDRAPRLTRFLPNPVTDWRVTHSITPLSNGELRTTLRAPLSGTATLLREGNTTEQMTLTGSVTVSVSKPSGRGWEPVVIRIDPPLVPERRPGDPLTTIVTSPATAPTPPALPTDPATGLQMPSTPPLPDTIATQQELANQVLMSVSTLAAGSPLPYRYAAEVETQLREIVSRFAPPGARVTGLSLDPVEWERVEVRDEDTLELVGPNDTAAIVGYLSGTVWLQDIQGNRRPSPLDPTSEHLVVNLHRRAGGWVVTNVSDGKVDTHGPEEVGAP